MGILSVWEVVGGASKGGIVVKIKKSVGSAEEPQRLGIGALLKEMELHGDRLRYRKLSGTGPDTGWVSIKFKATVLVSKTDMEAPAILWDVVGGVRQGGIVVREEYWMNSQELPTRLCTNAVIKEVDLQGDRLQFQLVSGSGPPTGWVSITWKDSVLVQPRLASAAETPAAGMTPSGDCVGITMSNPDEEFSYESHPSSVPGEAQQDANLSDTEFLKSLGLIDPQEDYASEDSCSCLPTFEIEEKRAADEEAKLASCHEASGELEGRRTDHPPTDCLSEELKTHENRLMHVEAKLAAYLKAHEELKKQVTDCQDQLTECVSGATKLIENRFAEHEGKMSACLRAQENLTMGAMDHAQLISYLSTSPDRKQAAVLEAPCCLGDTRDEGNLIENDLHAFQARLTKQQVVQEFNLEISDKIYTLLCQPRGEIFERISNQEVVDQIANLINDQHLEIQAQMQELLTALLEHTGGADVAIRCELEAFKEDTMLLLRAHEAAEKDFVTYQDLESFRETTKSLLRAQEVASKHYVHKQMSKLRAQEAAEKDFVTYRDLESFRETTKSLLRAQEVASKHQVHKQISKLHTDLSQTKGEIQEMLTSLLEAPAWPEASIRVKLEAFKEARISLPQEQEHVKRNYVTRGDWENVRATTKSLLHVQEAASKDHVDERVLKLGTHLSQIKDEQECALSELQEGISNLSSLVVSMKSAMHACKEYVDEQVPNLQAHLVQVKSKSAKDQCLRARVQKICSELYSDSDQAEAAIPGELEAFRDSSFVNATGAKHCKQIFNAWR